MSRNLADNGEHEGPLLLYNRTAERAVKHKAIIRAGSSRAMASLEEIATSSDVIFTGMVGEVAIEKTLESLLAHESCGKVFVDTSNIPPNTVSRLARMAEGRGGTFVYCPGRSPSNLCLAVHSFESFSLATKSPSGHSLLILNEQPSVPSPLRALDSLSLP